MSSVSVILLCVSLTATMSLTQGDGGFLSSDGAVISGSIKSTWDDLLQTLKENVDEGGKPYVQILCSLQDPLDDALEKEDSNQIINLFNEARLLFEKILPHTKSRAVHLELSSTIKGNSQLVNALESGKADLKDINSFMEQAAGGWKKSFSLSTLLDEIVNILV